MFVDRDEDRPQVRQVEQQVVHQVADLPVETSADNGRQANPVQSAQRMVGSEYVPPFGRNILFVYQFQIQVKISDQLLHERYPVFIVIPAEDLVQLILMNSTDQIVNHKTGNLTGSRRRLLP